MDVRYDPHALRRMRDRSVSAEEVVAVLQDPEVKLPARYGRRHRYRLLDSRRIKVTYYFEPPDRYYVWTVTADEVTT